MEQIEEKERLRDQKNEEFMQESAIEKIKLSSDKQAQVDDKNAKLQAILANMQALESEFDELDAEFDTQIENMLKPEDLTELDKRIALKKPSSAAILEEDDDDDLD